MSLNFLYVFNFIDFLFGFIKLFFCCCLFYCCFLFFSEVLSFLTGLFSLLEPLGFLLLALPVGDCSLKCNNNNNETGSRSPCMRPRSDPPKIKNFTPDKIVAEKKDNEANWMVSNSAKLDRRTKQHTKFGVSASNGSRDMARTKSWRKIRKKK